MNYSVKHLSYENKKHSISLLAIEEFSNHTFEEASLNKILLRANVSKGSFYYYFKNKKELYETCQTHTLKVFDSYVSEYTQEYEDFIERLLRINKFKEGFQNKYPEIVKFFMQQFYKRLFPKETLEHLDQLDMSFKQNLLNDVNYDLFRDDLNIEHALQLIEWTIMGYEKSVEEQTINNVFDYSNLEHCFSQSEAYFNTLKLVYYK